MAITHSADIQVGRIYPPLTRLPGISVEGNVPDRQEYDIATNVYFPDYTLTNLVLVPSLELADPSGEIPDGKATLSNMKWTLLENGTETAIGASTPGFSVASDGKLTVMRNCNGQAAMTLRFEADFLDTRTGEVRRMKESHLVACEGVSQRPTLSLDTSGMIAYDPLHDGEATRKVKASFKVNGTDVPASKRQFIWQKRDCDMDNVWATIDPDEDWDVEVSADGTELTVKLWLIGTRIDVRCYARYNPYGSPSAVQIDTRTPVAEFSAARIVGRLHGFVKGPKRLRPGVKSVPYEVVVWDSKGVIANPDEVLDVEWRVATRNANGTLSFGAVVARGSKVTVAPTFVAVKYGGVLKPFFGAKDPYAALYDPTDGKFLTDSGKLLVSH